MSDSYAGFREIFVFSAALIYWGGVVVNAYRIKRRIRRTPNLVPRGSKEILLWLTWLLIISGWIGQPFLIGHYSGSGFFYFIVPINHPGFIIPGILLSVGAYSGTIWCYSMLGDSWRIGTNELERGVLIKKGPYRFVRHPIYLFQAIILVGMALILPTPISFAIVMVHIIAVSTKALDEEGYLLRTHGDEYRSYSARTGRFLPKLKK